MKNEFMYCFQLSKMILFEVHYCSLSGNAKPYFSTCAESFVRSKRDFDSCGQAQDRLLSGLARKFWEKWGPKHLHYLTQQEYNEVIKDLEELKTNYNYLERLNLKRLSEDNEVLTINHFSFLDLVEFSKQAPKHN